MSSQLYPSQPLTFSPSQKFFNRQKTLIKHLWFLLPTNIDTHIKYSFQLIQPTYFIQWAEIEGFNSDHEISQVWIIYKLWFLNPKFTDIISAKINLEDVKTRLSQWILTSIKSFPLWQRAVFFILILLLPKFIWKALMRVNIIGLIIVFVFSIYKTTKFFINSKKYSNSTSIAGFDVQYSQHTDQLFFSSEMLSAIQNLKTLDITKVAYTWNCLYLYQTQISPALTQYTIQSLQSPSILSILSDS